MDFITRENLTKEIRPEVQTYMDKVGPNLEVLMQHTEKKLVLGRILGRILGRNWSPPHPRPTLHGLAKDELMIEIEKAVAQYLHKKGYNLTCVSGDTRNVIWINWTRDPATEPTV